VSGNSDHARRRLCSRRAKAKAAPRAVGFVPEIVDPLRWFDSQAVATWLLSQRQRQVAENNLSAQQDTAKGAFGSHPGSTIIQSASA
jgi:hypothetical protein